MKFTDVVIVNRRKIVFFLIYYLILFNNKYKKDGFKIISHQFTQHYKDCFVRDEFAILLELQPLSTFEKSLLSIKRNPKITSKVVMRTFSIYE